MEAHYQVLAIIALSSYTHSINDLFRISAAYLGLSSHSFGLLDVHSRTGHHQLDNNPSRIQQQFSCAVTCG